MSALSGPARTRRARTSAPSRRLGVAPRPHPHTSRAPFAVLMVVIVALGLVGLLVLNTTMQNNAFELDRLQGRAETLSTHEAALRADVQRLSSPGRVANEAGKLGMVPNTNPAFLRISDGKVIGEPQPAAPGTNLPGIEPEKSDNPTGPKKQGRS